MNKLLLSAVLLAAVPAVHAASVEADFVQTLARCDGQVFEFIRDHRQELSQYAPVDERNNTASFRATGNRGNSMTAFAKPMVVNGIEFTGFFSRAFDQNGLSAAPLQSYFWGLTVKESDTAKIAAALPQLKLQADGAYRISNPQIIADTKKSGQWQSVAKLQSDRLPQPDTAEKLLMLYRENNQTLLSCTAQGYLTAPVVNALRPDLAPQPQ